MLSKNKIKFIHSLTQKKKRDELGLFIAEGEKLIRQLNLSQYKFHTLITCNVNIIEFSEITCEKIEVEINDIKKISSLKNPPQVIAVCYQKKSNINIKNLIDDFTIVLDDIQDPGNLGTIIRLASWFGIKNIICSQNTVDCYNAKVIQATMGAIANVSVHYTKLEDFLREAKQNGICIYGTFLSGENIYTTNLKQNGIVVFGNEGNGISRQIENAIDHKLLIPTFASHQQYVESLNVSMATSIICSEFKRRAFLK